MRKYAGDAAQQGRVDALAPEDVVDILAVAVELACEPCHGALLAAQFLLDFVADMYHGGHIIIVWKPDRPRLEHGLSEYARHK